MHSLCAGTPSFEGQHAQFVCRHTQLRGSARPVCVPTDPTLIVGSWVDVAQRGPANQISHPGQIVPDDFVFPGTQEVNPREVFAFAGYNAPQQKTPAICFIALASLLLSPIPGVVLVTMVLGIFAIVESKRAGYRGWVISWIATIISCLVFALYLLANA